MSSNIIECHFGTYQYIVTILCHARDCSSTQWVGIWSQLLRSYMGYIHSNLFGLHHHCYIVIPSGNTLRGVLKNLQKSLVRWFKSHSNQVPSYKPPCMMFPSFPIFSHQKSAAMAAEKRAPPQSSALGLAAPRCHPCRRLPGEPRYLCWIYMSNKYSYKWEWHWVISTYIYTYITNLMRMYMDYSHPTTN